MPATDTSVPATATPGTEAAPAVTAPDMGGANTASVVSLASLKAARRAAAKAAPSVAAPAPVEAKPAEPAAAPASTEPATATIDMDAASLAQFTGLNKKLRAAQDEAKQLQAKIAAFAKYEKAEALRTQGRHYDAAREAGIDVDAAIADLLGKTPEQAQGSDELAKIKTDLEELRQAKADEEKARADQARTAAEQATERSRQAIVDAVSKAQDKFPMLSRSPDLVKAALADAEKAYEIIKAKGKADTGQDDFDLDAAGKNKLLDDALAVHEEKWAKTFGVVQPKTDPAKPATPGFGAGMRGNVTAVKTEPAKRMTFEEVRARRLRKPA